MNADKYEHVLLIAEWVKSLANNIGYDWKNGNDDLIQFKIFAEPKFRQIMKVIDWKGDIGDISDMMYTVADWNRFKKIYMFHPSFVKYLEDTESCKISTDVWKRLPFESFYIDYGHRIVEANDYMNYKNQITDSYGMFVRAHISDDKIDLGVEIIGKQTNGKPNGIGFVQEIQNGQNYDEAIDYIVKRDGTKLSDEEVIIVRDSWKPYFRIAINACQYLCASNAEIRDISVPKKDRPMIVDKQGKKKPVAIKVSNVGFHLGEKFERMYQDLESETRREGRKGIKKRPHVRRAHWHHYWTGPGRTVLEVRWLEPVFVMGTEEEIDTVIHEVEGGAA